MPSAEQIALLELPPMPAYFRVRNLKKPIWTQNKARLIQKYIYYFMMVTRHGTYIDGFAGPQLESDVPSDGMWSARLVLELEPRWLRHFYLFEKSPRQVNYINAMVAGQPKRRPKEPKRTVIVTPGDVNVTLPVFLKARPITEKEAAFCLLDQRTFECHWATVRAVADYKHDGMKIEQFYFFPIGWLDRSLHALKDQAKGDAWWGRDDWRGLRQLGSIARGELVADRFRSELGYKHAHPWPIYERPGGGRIMYFMVHASDHDEAPKLMWRAYHRAVEPEADSTEQFSFLTSP